MIVRPNGVVTIINVIDTCFSTEHLLLCWVSTVLRVVTVLPLFLSPYLPPLLTALCCSLPSNVSPADDASPGNTYLCQVVTKWKAISTQISTTIAPRVLVPVLSKCYTDVLQQQPVSYMASVCIIKTSELFTKILSLWQQSACLLTNHRDNTQDQTLKLGYCKINTLVYVVFLDEQ